MHLVLLFALIFNVLTTMGNAASYALRACENCAFGCVRLHKPLQTLLQGASHVKDPCLQQFAKDHTSFSQQLQSAFPFQKVRTGQLEQGPYKQLSFGYKVALPKAITQFLATSEDLESNLRVYLSERKSQEELGFVPKNVFHFTGELPCDLVFSNLRQPGANNIKFGLSYDVFTGLQHRRAYRQATALLNAWGPYTLLSFFILPKGANVDLLVGDIAPQAYPANPLHLGIDGQSRILGDHSYDLLIHHLRPELREFLSKASKEDRKKAEHNLWELCIGYNTQIVLIETKNMLFFDYGELNSLLDDAQYYLFHPAYDGFPLPLDTKFVV